MPSTYCEEEHAVHSKGGVTGVEGQSGEDKGIKHQVDKFLHKMIVNFARHLDRSDFNLVIIFSLTEYQLLFSCDKTRERLQQTALKVPEEDEEETGSDGEPCFC